MDIRIHQPTKLEALGVESMAPSLAFMMPSAISCISALNLFTTPRVQNLKKNPIHNSKQATIASPNKAHFVSEYQYMNSMNPKVDGFLRKAKKWQQEIEKLRIISRSCGLTEELKWGKPCYTFQKSNVVIIQGFKEFCALLFCKGALLNDPNGIFKKFGWQAARRIPFTNVREIAEMEPMLKAYIYEAIEAETAGLKVEFKKNPEPVPEELQNKLDEIPALKTAFDAL